MKDIAMKEIQILGYIFGLYDLVAQRGNGRIKAITGFEFHHPDCYWMVLI